MTQQDVVTRVRNLLLLLEGNNKTYRDGWDTDLDPSLIPIVPICNDYLALASLTGIKPNSANLLADGLSNQLAAPADTAGAIALYMDGIPLRRTTRQALDEEFPRWGLNTGDPRRWFREGSVIVLDSVPIATRVFVMRYSQSLTLFNTADPTTPVDGAIPLTALQRLAYGPAYLQGIVDAENPLQSRRLSYYYKMAFGTMIELIQTTDTTDYAAPVSLDDYQRYKRQGLPDLPIFPSLEVIKVSLPTVMQE